MSEDDDSNNDDWLRNFLNQQYLHAEYYCNAQTKLQNSLLQQQNNAQQSCSSKHVQMESAVLELSAAVQDVQQDLETLRRTIIADDNNNNNIHPRKQTLLQGHVELSERVVMTIYEHGGMYHPNGIPATKDDIEIKTVALASLRASIARLEESF
mmetsp:Transcript_29190/g.44130  ORF Transcript_29190/g.44130 Transcript_29190/m.44130 type:complete len:154 (-) Transcript_29190:318-779(-)|eukprot:CAMPEP_0178923552 /NCGR_PEP_ID=MMETSP0786-20121207/16791_1 /TAXON_ID=186022 /ORGANISM="Thalassionema frauenfeldii, Strain CCMP 1798" /LENGTH=153 /DNA_ID=CAMNT_0020598077 /DNA_START=51 /DNA_END=512 /DNA_ORIENTATION=+